MTDTAYDTLTLVGRHVPDEASGPFENMQQAMAAGHDTLNPVTGMYQFGALIDGAFVVLLEEKASLVFDAITLAKQNAAAAQPAPQAPPPEQPAEQPAEQPSAMQTGEQPAEQPAPATDQPQG